MLRRTQNATAAAKSAMIAMAATAMPAVAPVLRLESSLFAASLLAPDPLFCEAVDSGRSVLIVEVGLNARLPVVFAVVVDFALVAAAAAEEEDAEAAPMGVWAPVICLQSSGATASKAVLSFERILLQPRSPQRLVQNLLLRRRQLAV